MTDLVFLDTETTGLSPTRHEVIDIWATRTTIELGVIVEAGGLVVPKHLEVAEPRALEINHYDPDRWHADARYWLEVWEEVRPVLDGAVVVGSNPGFDVRFIEAMHGRYRSAKHRPGSHRMVDLASLALPLKRRGVVRSTGLDALCDHFRIGDHFAFMIDGRGLGVDAEAHTARGDVYRAIEVYRRLMGGLRWRG